MEECLLALGFAYDHAKAVVVPLRDAHDIRSKVRGHATGKEAAAIKKQVLKDHGTYKTHFHTLCRRCDESIRVIAETFRKLN
jgi:hypothetical protein